MCFSQGGDTPNFLCKFNLYLGCQCPRLSGCEGPFPLPIPSALLWGKHLAKLPQLGRGDLNSYPSLSCVDIFLFPFGFGAISAVLRVSCGFCAQGSLWIHLRCLGLNLGGPLARQCLTLILCLSPLSLSLLCMSKKLSTSCFKSVYFLSI